MGDSTQTKNVDVCIVGGGPAGLTAAYLLLKKGLSCVVLESDPVYVGGISRSHRYKGYLLDIGGHRFFSKWKEAEDIWSDILPDDMLTCSRMSRILYRGHFFNYPFSPFDALSKLGLRESLLCALSYLKERLSFSRKEPENFEEWVVRAFGRRFFEIFFKTYTEKVWGMDCRDISRDWASQRIKPFSVLEMLKNIVSGNSQTSLQNTFRYPRKGPGMMWEKMAEKINSMESGEILMGRRAEGYELKDGMWHTTYTSANGEGGQNQTGGGQIISKNIICSAPLGKTVPLIKPALDSTASANSLKYRDYLICALIFRENREILPDHWVYVHDPNVSFVRMQNYRAWSPELVPVPGTNCWGLEYFCFEGDGTWNMPDHEIIETAKREIVETGLLRPEDIIDGCVVRQPKAYPVYDGDYKLHVSKIRDELEKKAPGFYPVGRNGLHLYNNQDHSMMTALLTVNGIISGESANPWELMHQDTEYSESASGGSRIASSVSGERYVPRRES